MRADAKILLIICLLLLAGITAAADVSTITKTSGEWITANGQDRIQVTVNVRNTSGAYEGPVAGAGVEFSADSDYGTFSPVTVTTGPDGLATSTFTVGTRSGETTITATVSYYDAEVAVEKTLTPLTQQIDHDTRWIFSPSYTEPNSAEVNETLELTEILVTDEWGNPVDSRRTTDIVSLSISCPDPNDCEFVDRGQSLELQPDTAGYINITVRLGTICGANTIVMSPTHDLNQQMLIIDTGAADLTLTGEISPSSLAVPAGYGKFFFNYTLTDQFGNPGEGQPIRITSSTGETQLVYTDFSGKTPELQFGPKIDIGPVTLTAVAENSPEMPPLEFVVNFVEPMPPDMILFGTPRNIASLDKDSTSFAWVTAQIHDEFGAPISGQTVTFSVSYEPTANDDPSRPPHLESTTATTDEHGIAHVRFIPGAFNNLGPITATATVSAIWTDPEPDITKSTTYTWSNRPFLNINTNVNPTTVINGSEMDVTINVSVTGEYPPAPVTIMLDQDTSASMGNTRLREATTAMKTFVDKMTESSTQIGLETVGHDKSSSKPQYPYPYTEPTHDFVSLKGDLDELVKGDTTLVMDAMIYRSISELNAHTGSGSGHEDDIKVLILLSDGGTNLCNQAGLNALNQTAIDSNVYVFPICYNNNCNSGQSPVQMNALATATGGKFYTAANAAELDGVFGAIYEKIMELAGEKTQMTLVFQDIEVNDQMYNGNQLYDYVPVGIPTGLEPGVVSDPSSTVNENARSSIIWPNKTQSIVNQSVEWATNTLNFHVGAVALNEVWETTFRLKVKKAGCYNIFGSESKIELANEVRYLTETTVCVFEDPENKDFQFGTLAVDNLAASAPTDFKTLNWITRYTSPSPLTNKATVTVSYRVDGSNSWKVLYTTTANPGDNPQSTTIDVRNFPRDKPIWIQVHATAPDAASVDQIMSFTINEPYNPYYINLK